MPKTCKLANVKRDDLEDMYETMSTRAIAKKFKCSHSAVENYLRKYKIHKKNLSAVIPGGFILDTSPSFSGVV